MVDSPRRQRLNLPVAPLVAAVIGGVIALVFALIPTGLLEDLVIDSGIAAVVRAAEPPLGVTARAVLILAAGGGTGLIAWFGLFLLLGDRAIVVQKSGGSVDGEKAPVLRRADAHPDAPARRPLSATRELGTPFLEVRANRPVHARADETEIEEAAFTEIVDERPLPADLNTPLAAFDPEAIPDAPVEWSPQPATPVKPRQQVFDPGERFETFELTPMVRGAASVQEPVVDAPRAPLKFKIEAPLPPEQHPLRAAATASEPVPLSAIPRDQLRYAPIAAPEPTPAFAPAPSRQPEPQPVHVAAPIAAPQPMPSFAPTPAREPAHFFRTARPLRAEQVEDERPFAPARPRASARVELDPSASIHALLDRLERGVGRRESMSPPPPPPPHEESLQDALVTLRRLATRA